SATPHSSSRSAKSPMWSRRSLAITSSSARNRRTGGGVTRLVALGAVPAALLGAPACVVSTHGGVGAPLEVPPVPKAVPRDPTPSAPGSLISEPLRQERISARHILVAYKGALRAAPSVLRSREEAYARASEALKRA